MVVVNKTNKELLDLQYSLKNAYKIFGVYKKPFKEDIDAFKFVELCDLPYHVVSKLDFYDDTWNPRGTCKEVKYFFPRVLECLALHWLNKEGKQYCFFNKSIYYKLKTTDNWTEEERQSIRRFSRILFVCFINYGDINFIDEVFDFIFSVEDELDFYVNALEGASVFIKETIYLAIFNNWLSTDAPGNPTNHTIYYMKAALMFMDRKKIFLEDILKKYDLILTLEFLYQEPWDYIILNGIYPIRNIIEYIGKDRNNRYCVDINGQKLVVADIDYYGCKLIPGANYSSNIYYSRGLMNMCPLLKTLKLLMK